MRRPPRSLLITVTLACGLVAGLVFLHALPAVRAACGRDPLDTRPFWTRAEALELGQACGEVGIAAYTRLALLDLLHPALVAGCLMLWLSWSRSPRTTATRIVQVVIGLGAVSDYVENWAVWTLLRGGPGLTESHLLAIGGGVSLVKNILVSLGALGAAALILDAVRHRVLPKGVAR